MSARLDWLGWWGAMLHQLGRNPTPQELVAAAVAKQFPHQKMQVPKRQTAFTYSDGPMYYLGQQIVKAMEDAGYPAKILYCYRTPEHQAQLYAKGRTAPGSRVTSAPPWSSPHQYFEAVDIIHPSLAWGVTEEYWSALAACVSIVAEKFDVRLRHGHDWDGDGIPVHLDPDERFRDSAHIELADWREVQTKRKPSPAELWARFQQVLPAEAKRLERDGRSPRV